MPWFGSPVNRLDGVWLTEQSRLVRESTACDRDRNDLQTVLRSRTDFQSLCFSVSDNRIAQTNGHHGWVRQRMEDRRIRGWILPLACGNWAESNWFDWFLVLVKN